MILYNTVYDMISPKHADAQEMKRKVEQLQEQLSEQLAEQGEGEDAAALQALISHAKEEAQRAAEQKLREKER